MLLTLLATSLALQGATPQLRGVSPALASSLLDSLEAAELRFMRDWGRAWRLSEGTRHDFTYSEKDVRPRNVQLHCHPPGMPGGQVSAPASSGGRSVPIAQLPLGLPVPTIVKDPESAYAICPTWTFADAAPSDERLGIDGALTDPLKGPVRGARQSLLAMFDSAAALLPSNDWIAGQRVRLAVDQRDLDRALRVADECQATRWWCIALAGYVVAARGNVVVAESIFVASMAAMHPAQRCAWTDLGELIDLEDRPSYARVSCAARDSVNTRLWWLADPLYIEPGNERRVEQYVRNVLVALHGALDRDERYDWRVGAGANPLERVVTRYGWPAYAWWGGPRNEQGHSDYLASHNTALNETYTTFEYSFGRIHAFPAWRAVGDPLHARASDWQVSAPDSIDAGTWWTREHFAPHKPLEQLPDGQQAFFRRRNSVIFATAHDLDRLRFNRAAGDPIKATLVATDRPGSFSEIAHAGGRAGQPLILRADLPSKSTLVSVEFPAGNQETFAGGRVRFAITPPPPLLALKKGEYAISDPVILLAPPNDDLSPGDIDAALARMAGSTRAPNAGRMGVYWETYGFSRTDSVNVAVWIERYTPQGIVRGLGIVLGIATDMNTPVAITWSEPNQQRSVSSIQDGGTVPILGRGLTLDVSQLVPGDYWLDVAIGKRGMQPVRGRRGFSIR